MRKTVSPRTRTNNARPPASSMVSGEADSATTVRARGRTRLDVWVEPARVGFGFSLATGGFCIRAGGRRTGVDGVGVDCGCTKTRVWAGACAAGGDGDGDGGRSRRWRRRGLCRASRRGVRLLRRLGPRRARHGLRPRRPRGRRCRLGRGPLGERRSGEPQGGAAEQQHNRCLPQRRSFGARHKESPRVSVAPVLVDSAPKVNAGAAASPRSRSRGRPNRPCRAPGRSGA